MKNYSISKDNSTKIKGIAIMVMIIHHFFTFPEWYVVEYSKGIDSFAAYMCEPTKICAAIFAFITGWAYALNQDTTLRNSFKKIVKFLLNYWVIYIVCFAIAYTYCDYRPSFIEIVLEMLGFRSPLMCFCWYTYFYIISILLLIKIVKIWDKNIFLALFMGVILPVVGCFSLGKIINSEVIDTILYNFGKWFPCICMGYIFNRYNLFEKIKNVLQWDQKTDYLKVLYAIIIISICGIGGFFANDLIFLYSACTFFSFAELMKLLRGKRYLNRLLMCLGTASANMWFIHSIFFTSVTIT